MYKITNQNIVQGKCVKTNIRMWSNERYFFFRFRKLYHSRTESSQINPKISESNILQKENNKTLTGNTHLNISIELL